ncbi:MAG: sterol desaturase family protein [SAR324 cluster bacterium]|nr:sterol desaturase family protein [SAR324 cluster bacterium]
MNTVVTEYEVLIRLGLFFGVFLLVAVCEVMFPRRALTASKLQRWVSNLGLVFLNSLVLRLIFPVLAVGMAVLSKDRGWGLLNNLEWHPGIEIVIAVVVLDFAIYLQHVVFHAVPALWRLHRMHHTDVDIDVSTGTRFHPLEIVLSMGIKLAVVAILGPSAIAVLIFEVLLNATAMFNHGNILIPHNMDSHLRWMIVTPDMHRVHHSILAEETHSNFGFNLPWWDRLLGTYRPQPKEGHLQMTIGIELFREAKHLLLPWLLIQPFLKNGASMNSTDRENSRKNRKY